MTVIIGSGNPRIGTVQSNAYLDRIESMNYNQIALSVMGETIDIPSYQAEVHTIRSYDEIGISDSLLVPLNENVLNAERIETVTGSVVTMRTAVYGVTIVISEKSRVNSPENIAAAVSTLLSDYEMRLKEQIIYNALQNANLVEYVFTQGGTTSPKKANMLDLVDATTLMEENDVRPNLGFISAVAAEHTRPVPQRYALVSSIKGASAFKKNLTSEDFTQTHRFAGISAYGFESKGVVDRANVEIFSSSEMTNGSGIEREAFIFGAQPFYKTGKTPLNSRMTIRPASESAYGMHTKVEKRTVFGVALSDQNRIIKISFTD